MKILYISCHAILEYDEVKLFTELGHEVDSFGAYRDPRGAYTLPRPGIEGMWIKEEFIQLTGITPKTDIPQSLIDQYDTIIFMSGEQEAALLANWPKLKKKRVIWRTIGQSTGLIERAVQPLRKEGLQIVRYSPKEANVDQYTGSDALIRFYKDPDEFFGWIGEDKRPINFTQSLRGRGRLVHYDEIMGSLVGFEGAKVYGTGNTDLGSFNGGEVTYEYLKQLLRDCRVFVYGGTFPASYTLSFIEAMMTGIPIVALGEKIIKQKGLTEFDYYEIPNLLIDGETGYVCQSIEDMRRRIDDILHDSILAARLSVAAREKAIDLFGKKKIADQWKKFLEGGL